ncbi:hypothetical protein Q0Z83_049150 [Actinoplanes sichuanensis]|nr:hypothetical protein Q0Z83_049150 [Actinoplanes sichuanensis]
MRGRQGDLAAAGRIVHDVHAWAVERRHAHLLALSHWHLASLFAQLGDATSQLQHAVGAMESVNAMPAPSVMLRLRCTMALADAYGDSGDFASARERYAESERLAVEVDDIRAHTTILNNLAYTEHQAGDLTAATRAADRMLTLAHRHEVRLDDSTLDTVAKVWLAAGRHTEAIDLIRHTRIDRTGPDEDANSVASCLVTLAEAYRLVGELDQAHMALQRCRVLCTERGLAGVELEVLREYAQLLATQRRFEEAFLAHQDFHAAAMRLHSGQRDARARVLQAVYEIDEARQARRRAQEMAMRDSLTGLYNRRFVEAELPVLLHRAAEKNTALSLAVLDLDFFKRINDTCSHGAGDRVLQKVADLISARAQILDGAFGARLGGEEFLFVMPGIDGAEAVAQMSRLRQAIREHDWRPVTGSLPVTTSIGVTSTRHGHGTATDLLHQADLFLYQSKANGRDRITSADDQPADPSR